MGKHTKISPGNNTKSAANAHSLNQRKEESDSQFADNRPEAIQAAQLQKIASSNPVNPIQQHKTASGNSNGQVIQRLELERTNWTDVTTITASTDGVGGVLFVADRKGRTLVVKPNVPGDEEMAAAHAHSGVEGGKRGKWKVKALDSRMSTANDVGGLRVARQRVEGLNGPLDARAGGLMDDIGIGDTLIQKTAGRNAESLSDAMMNQSVEGHIIPGEDRIGSDKNKVKPESPLKPLVNIKTGFAKALGRLAAADILLGNFDRLADAANLENLLLNKKAIHPIDNTGGTAVARLLTGGGGNVAQPGWTGHRLGALFIAQNYDAIALEAFSDNPNATISIYNDLLTGFSGVIPNRKYNVLQAERQAVKAKLDAHIAEIRAEYAAGLQEGRDKLVQQGAMAQGAGVNDAARQQYAARLAMI